MLVKFLIKNYNIKRAFNLEIRGKNSYLITITVFLKKFLIDFLKAGCLWIMLA
jgi:hypothetical protein